MVGGNGCRHPTHLLRGHHGQPDRPAPARAHWGHRHHHGPRRTPLSHRVRPARHGAVLWLQTAHLPDRPALQHPPVGFPETSPLLILFLPLLQRRGQPAHCVGVVSGGLPGSAAVLLPRHSCPLLWRGEYVCMCGGASHIQVLSKVVMAQKT